MLSVAISFPHSTLAWDEVYWNMISLGPRPRASKSGNGTSTRSRENICTTHRKEHNGSTKISRSPTDVLRAAILWYQEGEASRLHVHDEASAPATRQDGEGRGEDMRTSLAPFLSHSPARMRVHHSLAAAISVLLPDIPSEELPINLNWLCWLSICNMIGFTDRAWQTISQSLYAAGWSKYCVHQTRDNPLLFMA